MSYYLDPAQLWLPPLPSGAAGEVCSRTQTVAQWAEAMLGFHADPVQAQILNADTHRLAVCCSRQWGKTSVAAVKALHLAWRKPGALILFASPCFDQSAELLRVFRGFAARLIGAPCQAEPGRKGSILLPNGSRILALPQSSATVRGYVAPDLIVVDEAAIVIDRMFDALSPMLAVSNGQLWLLSSPNGQIGEFYDAWHSKSAEWQRFSVTADRCPRISPEFLARERRAKGDAMFRKEYLCQFLPHSRQAIPRELIEEAFRGTFPAQKWDD